MDISAGSGVVYFAASGSSIISTMVPLIDANKKTINITSDIHDLGSSSGTGAARFTINTYQTGFVLLSNDTTAINNCQNKIQSFSFSVNQS